jgi:FHA domain/Domain of unknown function (DUF1707)
MGEPGGHLESGPWMDARTLRCEDAGVGLRARVSVPPRASAAERERAIRRLREGRVSERLSLETFAERVELAYAAENREQLDELLADLRQRGPMERAVAAGVTTVSRWAATVEWAWRRARLPRLALPAGDRAVIGRSRDCDCVVGNPTVSRTHALLRHAEGRWCLRDLGSLNGTWLNGRRVVEEVQVLAGDEVAFEDAVFALAPSLADRQGLANRGSRAGIVQGAR